MTRQRPPAARLKRKPLDLLITLERTEVGGEGLSRQIYRQLRTAILDGRLRAGDRLPPSRDLAATVGVARLTVATAYEWLQAEGYVFGRVGAGTFVASAFGEELPGAIAAELSEVRPTRPSRDGHVIGPAAAKSAAELPPKPLSSWAGRIAQVSIAVTQPLPTGLLDLRPGSGDAALFPWARWRRVTGGIDPLGPPELVTGHSGEQHARNAVLGPLHAREMIAGWLRRSRAVRCSADQLLLANSVQQILALLARLFVDPGQRVLVEDPSYTGFHAAFIAEGAKLVGIPVDTSGLQTERLPRHDHEPTADTPRMLIVTPSHQYPTGVTLSLERRLALLAWARRAGVVLIEDDYDGDLRLEGQPLEALRGIDDADEVIYIGTFAKALYPAARLAYAVLPRWLTEPIARARAAGDRHPRWHEAEAVARFIAAGELERHLARLRRVYRARRDAFVAALDASLDDRWVIGPAEAGVHLTVRLPDGTDDLALAAAAEAEGVAITPLSRHYLRNPQPGLLIGFGGQDEHGLTIGAQRIAAVVARELATR